MVNFWVAAVKHRKRRYTMSTVGDTIFKYHVSWAPTSPRPACDLCWGPEAESVSAPWIAPWCCPRGLEPQQAFSPPARCSCYLTQLKAKTNLFNQSLSEFLNYILGRNLICLIKKVYFMVIQFCYAARLNVSSGGSVCYKYSLPHSNTLSHGPNLPPLPHRVWKCVSRILRKERSSWTRTPGQDKVN